MDAAPKYVLPKPNLQPLSAEVLDFFRQRGISAETLEVPFEDFSTEALHILRADPS